MKAAAVAEYGRCRVRFSTHLGGRITRNGFIRTAEIRRCLAEPRWR